MSPPSRSTPTFEKFALLNDVTMIDEEFGDSDKDKPPQESALTAHPRGSPGTRRVAADRLTVVSAVGRAPGDRISNVGHFPVAVVIIPN